MKVKNKIIASAVAVMMLTSAAPMTVSAASKAKAPSKVSITSVKRVNNTKANVKWKKLKKAPDSLSNSVGEKQKRSVIREGVKMIVQYA